MKQCLFIIILLLNCLSVMVANAEPAKFVQSGNEYKLLNNRFRIDSSISEAAFIIYKNSRSTAVILVGPDGTKYHPWDLPEGVSWHTDALLDIVLIKNPIPGPWQVIGSLSPKNKVQILSNVKLNVAKLPDHLYQYEEYKLVAKLTENEHLVKLYDFLTNIKLGVEFTGVIPKILEKDPKKNYKRKSIASKVLLDDFVDDGSQLDEVAADGQLTSPLHILVEPGKYKVSVVSKNQVFLRALEQEVLVYPLPFAIKFSQGDGTGAQHVLKISANKAEIKLGTIAVHINIRDPFGDVQSIEALAKKDSNELTLYFPITAEAGRFAWDGFIYATDITGREFSVKLPKKTFLVVDKSIKQAEAEEQAKLQQQEKESAAKAVKQKKRSYILWTVIITNLVVILLMIAGIFFWIKRKNSKLAEIKIPELDDVNKDKKEEDEEESDEGFEL